MKYVKLRQILVEKTYEIDLKIIKENKYCYSQYSNDFKCNLWPFNSNKDQILTESFRKDVEQNRKNSV